MTLLVLRLRLVHSALSSVLLFFMKTSTTECYTDCPTLSLLALRPYVLHPDPVVALWRIGSGPRCCDRLHRRAIRAGGRRPAALLAMHGLFDLGVGGLHRPVGHRGPHRPRDGQLRTEERRVGKQCVGTGKTGGWQYH